MPFESKLDTEQSVQVVLSKFDLEREGERIVCLDKEDRAYINEVSSQITK